MAYWTTSEEPKPVYHIYNDCGEGKKIEAKHRVDGPNPERAVKAAPPVGGGAEMSGWAGIIGLSEGP